MNKINTHPIEAESMKIIENKVDLTTFDDKESPIVKRIIHTTGDLEIHKQVKFSEKAILEGLNSLKQGTDIFTDVTMVTAGLNKKNLNNLGCNIHCNISDQKVREISKTKKLTRAETSFELFGENIHNKIVAIGNAPTALFKVIELYQQKNIKPALVVGVPVGFVGAMESKESLRKSGLDYITITGYKGGSPIAASIINALLRLM
ncbi:precorrin-8X methylmutase [Natranaerobius trueperi]|uniref:Precorrin isomerase n=1 Tax=Natranaerobius trueperi TaxID=759412 RepID=A0A226BVR1_9FIRM|nr:precorrin-8X methylmutase [Natranaerobius trueperi]OWZ82981.1 precorrin isomerase [Natranaerobius trueperi]